ncbi:short chain dehydrogenase [Auriscalpium vulgare]|uniref:Short chain dehydrogenase n=1 Tax=Auriscalpium vulgare TaxID=40419 RepID=A0ACB8R9Q1_9AGAM|nr:short chain dehydrogenase [Auriscalpium vulgare]
MRRDTTRVQDLGLRDTPVDRLLNTWRTRDCQSSPCWTPALQDDLEHLRDIRVMTEWDGEDKKLDISFPNRSTMTGQLVWLITGCSSGIGRDLTLEALKRGDKVIATARGRSITRLADLKSAGADVLELDVTAPLEDLHAVAKTAVALHGHVDVLVNNAGYIAVGALEENTPEETLAQFNTNVFGGLNVARAFLPYMRPRRTGTVVWFGSIVGWRTLANCGLYSATKVVNRMLAEALHLEIAPLGLRSLCVEPGYFRTAFLTDGNRAPYVSRIEDYREVTAATDALFQAANGRQPGDPARLVAVLVDCVRGEGAAVGRELPGVLHLGTDCVQEARGVCEETLQRIDAWGDVFASTDFPEGT